MRLRQTLSVCGVLLASCSLPASAADAIPGGNGGSIVLGKNWGPYETFGGASFRWVADDAEIIVRGNTLVRARISCEGGPSLGAPAFPLRVLDESGRQVDHVDCSGREHSGMLLLPVRGESRFLLHVDGGGRVVANEKRTLNFRVFALDAGGAGPGMSGDIVSAQNGIRLGARWDPIEHFKGQTFRWVDTNDAQFYVTARSDLETRIRALVEAGPSIGAPSTMIAVKSATGTVLVTSVRGLQALVFPVHLRRGENAFTLHVAQTKNARIPTDRRLLNLRVFSIAALR